MRGTRASGRPSAGTREPGSRASRSSRSSRRDAAVVPVVEAIIIALIVGGAMIFAASFQTAPPPTAAPGAHQLEERSWDAFRTLDGMHYEDPSAGNSSLSKAVRDALAGEPENLTAALETYLPPGAQFNVYLNNGFDRLTVYESRQPSGQSVGISYPFEPRWRTTFTEPALKYYGTAASPTLAMGVTNIPLFNSNLVPGEGHLVKAEAVGHQDWVPGALSPKGSTAFHETGYATLLQGNDDVSYTSASVYMTCQGHEDDGGRPCYAMDLTKSTVDTYGPNDVPLTDDKGIPIVVENNGEAVLPAGAKVTVELPVGIEVNNTWDGDLVHDWTLGVSGAAPSPQTVTARLGTDLDPDVDATAWFQINVTSTDDRYAFKQVTTSIESRHASSESDLLLKVNDRAPEALSGGDTRVMLVSGPQPAGSKTTGGDNAEGRWGMVLTNPVKATTLQSINLSLPDGEGLFETGDIPDDVNGTYTGTVYGPYGDGGWKLAKTDDHISFYFDGVEHEMPAWSFAEMQFMVETDGRFTKASPAFPTTQPETRYPGFAPGPMSHQTEPGVWWGEYPPQTGQPDPHAGYSLDQETLTGRLEHRNHVLSGQGSYQVEDLSVETESLVTIQDAVRASSVTPAERKVPVGTTTTITLQASDLATVLSSELPVNDLTMHTNIYAPWGVDARIPAEVQSHSAQAGLQHLPNDLELQDLDGDGLHDLVAAYTDGNVYGIAGDSGSPVSGMTWPVPDGGEPTLLTKGRDQFSNPFYGVGTAAGTDNVSLINHDDPDIEKWSASKHPTDAPGTLAVNASLDIDGDDHGDLLVRQPSDAPSPYAGVSMSKLLLFSGDDGTLFPGRWTTDDDDGVLIPGRWDQIGMGVIGPQARNGVFSNTAGGVGTSVVTQQEDDWTPQGAINLDDPTNPGFTSPVSVSSSISVVGSGLMGFFDDGSQAWNYSGGDFIRLTETDKIPTGGAWSGILAGGGEGFLYGLSGEVPVNPADGWIWPGFPAHQDLDMANDLEGYTVTPDGYVAATRSGMANWIWGGSDTYQGLRTVGTVKAPYNDTKTAVVYAAGDNGGIYRSPDRLQTIEDISGIADVLNAVDISLDDGINLDPSALESLDIALVDFKDVYVESPDEAYIVGGGKTGTSADGNAYIVHTVDAGASLLVTEIACEDLAGSSISGCALHGIASNGSALWATGTHGMVLHQDITGDMTNVALREDQPDPKVSGDAFVHLNLSNTAATEITDLQLLWSNQTDLSHYQNLRVDTGSGNTTLWSLAEDGLGLYVDGSFDASKGAGRGAALDLRSFDDNKDLLGDPDDNIWDGDATLKVGPFVNETTDTTPITAADFPAVNMTFVLTYADGTQDLMTVGVGPDTVDDTESPGGAWSAADTTPDCFGPPDTECTTHHSINFTTDKASGDVLGVVAGEHQEEDAGVGQKKQWPLYRLDAGSTDWVPQRNLYHDVTLYDAAIGTHDVDRWAAVGEGSRVFMSFNTGENWTELPPVDVKDRQISDLKAVDLTHPTVGYAAGGSAAASSVVTLGGYSEFGQLVTTDVYNNTQGQIKDVIPDTSNLDLFVDGGFNSKVEIQVQDPDGSWKTIVDSQTGSQAVELSSPTDVITLRWNLSVPNPWNRFSPQAVGSLDLELRDTNGNTPSTTIDLSKGWMWDSGTSTVELDTDRSMVRLVPAQVPWLTKLGNYTDAERGARPADMDISPDGWTAYVGTEGVYEIGGAYQSVPVGSDNTLYAFNITDGIAVPGFTPYTFDDPIQFVRAHEHGIFVITDDVGQPTRLYNMTLTGSVARDTNLGTGKTVIDAEVGDLLPNDGNQVIDIALAMQNDLGAGSLEVIDGVTLIAKWDKSPAVKGFFQFNYPVDLGSMFGAYVIQTEFEWTMTTEDDRSITQSARIHNAFTVTPPNRKVALSPTYTLELVAWMEDWG